MVAVHNLLEVGNDKGVAGSVGSQLNQFYLFIFLLTRHQHHNHHPKQKQNCYLYPHKK